MISRRTIVGIAILSALALSAFTAPSAFATKGTTAFTCVKDDVKPAFQDAHCKESWKSGGGYRHEEIKTGGETSITVSNKNTANNTTEHTPVVLHAVLGGGKATITCTKVHGEGTFTNNSGPPMNLSGTVTVTFSECTAELNGKVCESVNEGKGIVTRAVAKTPTEAMEMKFEEDGESFAKFNIKCGGKNFECNVKGSTTGIPEGTTEHFTEASTKGNAGCTEGVCVSGQPAWVEATATITMSTTEPGIALTTTET